MKSRSTLEFALRIVTACACLAISAPAQILLLQEYRGKQITCGISGLRGFGDDCGFKYYDSAFLGTIVSIRELPQDEFQLVVRPTEVFKSEVPSIVTVTTTQGACFPGFVIGEQWILALRRNEKTKDLTLDFGSPSGPASKEMDLLSRFRLLAKSNDSGLIIGEVTAPSLAETENDSSVPRANQKVLVRSIPEGTQYIAFTNGKGEFAFDPLPVGEYEITADKELGFWNGGGAPTTVEAHECRDYHIEMRMDGTISGRVILPNGDSTRTWGIDAIPLGNEDVSSGSAYTDDEGNFEIHGLSPGRYVIGIEVVGVSSRYDLNFGVFAPGVGDRNAAEVVDLRKNEKRSGVDIRIPAAAIPAPGITPHR